LIEKNKIIHTLYIHIMTKRCVIVLLGAPGSGKGTVSNLLKDFGFYIISISSIIKEEIEKNTKLHEKISNIISKGRLIPDIIVNKILKKKICEITKTTNKIVFDGYPRTIEQAKYLDTLLTLDFIFNINVLDKIIINRTKDRFVCNKCGQIYNKTLPPKNKGICDKCGSNKFIIRDDDNPKVIKSRLQQYKKNISCILSYYNNIGAKSNARGGTAAKNSPNARGGTAAKKCTLHNIRSKDGNSKEIYEKIISYLHHSYCIM
jgi:adenylate kinase